MTTASAMIVSAVSAEAISTAHLTECAVLSSVARPLLITVACYLKGLVSVYFSYCEFYWNTPLLMCLQQAKMSAAQAPPTSWLCRGTRRLQPCDHVHKEAVHLLSLQSASTVPLQAELLALTIQLRTSQTSKLAVLHGWKY